MTTTDMQTSTDTEDLTVDLRESAHAETSRVRTATIDLSGVGAAIQLGDGAEPGEVLRLTMGLRTVHVVDLSHRLVPALFEREIAAVSVGRDEAEFTAWLRDTPGANFVVVSTASAVELLSLDNVRSLARLVRQPTADHALRELATLLGRHPEDMINDFRERTGFSDLAGLVDLRTLSVTSPHAISAKEYSSELGLLIDAVTTVVMVMAGRGEVSVITTSLEPIEQRWMIEAGWPLAETLDNDLAEILRGSRSRAGRSVPSWVRAHGLWGAVASQRTVSMTNVATHLHRNRLDLGACIPRGRARHSA